MSNFVENAWYKEVERRTPIVVNIVNLTPHNVNFIVDGESTIEIAPEPIFARLTTRRVPIGHIEYRGVKIPVNCNFFGEVVGLPDRRPGTIYVVSNLIAHSLPERDDLYVPDHTVRDGEGKVIGAKGLSRVFSLEASSHGDPRASNG